MLPKISELRADMRILRLLSTDIERSTLSRPSEPGPNYDLILNNIAELNPTTRLPERVLADKLVSLYFEHSNFFSPILHQPTFLRRMDALYAVNDNELSTYSSDLLCCFLVFAIAVQLMDKTNPSVPSVSSDRYIVSASAILADQPDMAFREDLHHMEILLLLVQYNTLNQDLPGAWHLIGLALRLSVDYGLHEDPPSTERIDPLTFDRRRRLFWAIYSAERNMGCVLGRPFGVPDEAINVQLPLPIDDENVTSTGIKEQVELSTKSAAIHLIKYRQFESEIQQMLHQRSPIGYPVPDYSAWRREKHAQLEQWYKQAPNIPSLRLAPASIFAGLLHNAMVTLYSPTRYLPSPRHQDLVSRAQSSCNLTELYRQSMRTYTLRFYWRATHNLFKAGTGALYCLSEHIKGVLSIDPKRLIESVHTCSSVLWAMGERYPIGNVFRDTFEPMVVPTLERFELVQSNRVNARDAQADIAGGI